jgi:hypothetical protein
LNITQKGVASETILPRLTAKSVKAIADKHGHVDLIIARHILEHAPDTQKFLSTIWDMLNPDGYIVFEVPDCTKQLEFKDYSMPWEEHILYFVPETLKAFFNHTNYELVHYRKYPYITEDSQVAIVRKAKDKRITESKPISGIFALANEYANSYKQQRKRVCSYLKEYTAKVGKVAFYGAGHLSVMIINSLQIEGFIEFIADDTKQKQGKFLPGTSLEIKSSNALEKKYKSTIPYRQLAVRLLQEDLDVYKKMHDEPIWIEMLPIVREGLNHIYLHTNTKDLDDIFVDEHFAFAKGAKMEVMSVSGMKATSLTQKIDNLLINKFLGIPLFLFFMWGLFQLTFELGSVPMDYIDAAFGWLGDQAKAVLGEGELGSLVADGMIAGVGAVIMFLPNIIILFARYENS